MPRTASPIELRYDQLMRETPAHYELWHAASAINETRAWQAEADALRITLEGREQNSDSLMQQAFGGDTEEERIERTAQDAADRLHVMWGRIVREAFWASLTEAEAGAVAAALSRPVGGAYPIITVAGAIVPIGRR